MPKFLINRWHGLHQVVAFILLLVLTIIISFYSWKLSFVAMIVICMLGVYSSVAERAFRRDLNVYLSTIMFRVNKAGQDVTTDLPLGIIVYDDHRNVEWHNSFVSNMLERESVIGVPLTDLFPTLKATKDKEGTIETVVGNDVYELMFRFEDRLLYIRNITQRWELARRYEDEKPALGIVLLDSLEEVTLGMDDQQRINLLSKVTAELTEWARKHHLYMKKFATDRFLIVTDQKTLKQLEQLRFGILDTVREMTSNQKIPLTLSIGFAAGSQTIVELGRLAQTSLDIALARGGDQASVKVGQRQSFYGGRTTTVEKRTRVRARTIAHTFKDLIRDSDNIIIMGHKVPDMDSIGAAVGVLKAAQLLNKEAHIVLEGPNPSISKLLQYLYEDEKYERSFVTPEQAALMIEENTLVVVVDTHKASMVKEPKLLQIANKIVVIDHHRRGEEFINQAMLVYLESTASSACELITELLPYLHDRVVLDVRSATTMLAGIALDTKSFSLRTSSRTFEAASFLKRSGADSATIQRLLKEELKEYVQKADIVKHAEIVYDHIAIAATEYGKKYSQLLIAQSADTLLNMTGIYASFVIGERHDGLIGISARSLGQLNVQIVMERMGGGGHLTNAAAQIEGTVMEAEQRLKKTLAELNSEERLFE